MQQMGGGEGVRWDVHTNLLLRDFSELDPDLLLGGGGVTIRGEGWR